MGCRYCMVACPFGVPKYEWSKLLPRVQKCTMCLDRVQAGKPTACAETCPMGATKFGERDANQACNTPFRRPREGNCFRLRRNIFPAEDPLQAYSEKRGQGAASSIIGSEMRAR